MKDDSYEGHNYINENRKTLPAVAKQLQSQTNLVKLFVLFF